MLIRPLFLIISTTICYVIAIVQYVFLGYTYKKSKMFSNDMWARVQVFSLSLIFKMWKKSHYRSKSYQQDMIDNLKNVAIPGTGVPLSVFCYSWWMCLLFVIFMNPIVCLFGAINKSRKSKKFCMSTLAQDYIDHLLHPQDWFSFWRLNCRLVSYHSLLTKSKDYDMEDKWTFLVEGKKYGVPISPYLEVDSLVCKNKNIEGGMGIFFYRNATQGGDWIIQNKLTNSKWLSDLLPKNSPLSTMRVITSSEWWLDRNSCHVEDLSSNKDIYKKYIKALSGVLRLGREGAATDHSSALFDVDITTGKILNGVSNMHWYQLGPIKALSCPWLPPATRDTHPDPPYHKVSGNTVPNIENVIEIVTR